MGVRISYTSTCISVARMENTRLVPSPVPKMPFGMSIFAPLSYSFFRPENLCSLWNKYDRYFIRHFVEDRSKINFSPVQKSLVWMRIKIGYQYLVFSFKINPTNRCPGSQHVEGAEG